jgi:monoamine oxidase
MRALVRELGLELLDLEAPGEAGLTDTLFFGGHEYREADILKAFLPLAPRIRADQTKLGKVVTYRRPGNAAELDQMSLAAYLDRLGAAGWLRALVEAAFVGEFGLDADRQSALNLLLTISTDFKGGQLKPFGDHDERYKVKGGNHRVAAALARRLDGQIRREHRPEALRSRGPGFRLTFAGPNARAREVDADLVVLCLPFTLLRLVDLRVEMPPAKKKAIAELGYGTNAKVLAGFQTRFWRSGQKRSGEILTDEPLGIAWDNSRLQPGPAGGLTFFSGGRGGVDVGNGTAEEQVKRLLPGLEKVFAGAAREHNGKAGRFHWPSHPLTRGSYPCYLPGQWTTLAGAEGEAVGHLFFAGDHCSRRFQGFMNGAAESGRRAAEALAAVVR